MHAWDYVPYERPDGRSWDEAKREYAERMIAHMARFIENLGPTDILQYHCDSPVDMERTSPSFRRGDLHGIATTTYQSRLPPPDARASASTPSRVSSGSTSSDRSSIRAAACSAPAARQR